MKAQSRLRNNAVFILGGVAGIVATTILAFDSADDVGALGVWLVAGGAVTGIVLALVALVVPSSTVLGRGVGTSVGVLGAGAGMALATSSNGVRAFCGSLIAFFVLIILSRGIWRLAARRRNQK